MVLVTVSFKIEAMQPSGSVIQGKIHRKNHLITPEKYMFSDMYLNANPKTDGTLRVVLNATNSWNYTLKTLVKTNRSRIKPAMRITGSQALTFDLKLLGDAPEKGYTQYLKLVFK